MTFSIGKDLAQRFPNRQQAEAFFSGAAGDAPGFRLMIDNLGWEFADGFNIGNLLKGTFFYSDLPLILEDCKAKYHVDLFEIGGNSWAYISFYTPGPDTELLGVFLGKDKHDVVAGSKLLHTFRLEGLWKRADYIHSTAKVLKAANSTEFTVICKSLGLTTKFHCNRKDKSYTSSIAVDGMLTVKDLEKVKKVSTVKWYPGHLVLYEDTTSARYSSAYFLVNESNPLGQETAGKEWSGVEWLDAQSLSDAVSEDEIDV